MDRQGFSAPVLGSQLLPSLACPCRACQACLDSLLEPAIRFRKLPTCNYGWNAILAVPRVPCNDAPAASFRCWTLCIFSYLFIYLLIYLFLVFVIYLFIIFILDNKNWNPCYPPNKLHWLFDKGC